MVACAKHQQKKKEESEKLKREMKSGLLVLDLKRASCKIMERKKKAKHSRGGTFLG